MEIAEAAVSCIGLVQFLGKVVFFVMEIKDTPGDIREKQDKVANCSQRLIQLLESPLLEKHQKNTLVSRSRGYKDSLHQLQDLLKPVCPNSRQGSASLLWHSIKARVNKEDIKNAFDRVLQAQKEVDSCIMELMLSQLGEVRKSLCTIGDGQVKVIQQLIQGQILTAETLASAARIENGIADGFEGVTMAIQENRIRTVEELRELKLEYQELRQEIKDRLFHNQGAWEGNQQIAVALNQDGFASTSKTVALASRRTAFQTKWRSCPDSEGCACVPSVTRQGILQDRFVAEFFTEHNRDCPYYEGGLKKWSYCAFPPWWSYSLLPGIRRKFVTIGWAQSSGAGADSVSPILKMTRKVRRSESPVFNALDDFRASVDWIDRFDAFFGFSHVPSGMVGSPRKEVSHYNARSPHERILDDGHLRRLQECRIVIESAFRRRRAFPTDVDESGKSVWQTVLELARLALDGHHDDLLPGLVGLLIMLLNQGVKPDQEHRGPDALTLKSLWDSALKRANMAFVLGRTPSFEDFRLPGYMELEKAGFVEERGRTESFLNAPPFTWRSIAQRYPELLIDLELPAVSEQLLLSPTVEEFKSEASHQNIRLWDRSHPWMSKRMMLGWKDVIQYLGEAGCGFDGALNEACFQSNIEMVHALLRIARLPITAPDLDSAFRATNIDILNAVVKELVARRIMLCQVSNSILEPTDLDKLCMDGQSLHVPNDKIQELLQLLAEKYVNKIAPVLVSLPIANWYTGVDKIHRTAMSDELDAINRLRAVAIFDKYDFLDPVDIEPDYSRKIQCLLDAGFHGLEEPGANGETVLYRTCRLFSPSTSNIETKETNLIWLLGHSSEKEFPVMPGADDYQLASPIFYVASLLRHIDVAILEDAGVLGPVESIPTDCCECFCSADGCMPHYMFLRCDGNGCRYEQTFDACTAKRYEISARDGCLHQWCDALRLSPDCAENYYQEACRLEIFERLGMQHTCCAAGRRDNYIRKIPGTVEHIRARLGADYDSPDPILQTRWRRSDEAERSEIQAEDAELSRQLDLIMVFYRIARIRFFSVPIRPAREGDYDRSFWASWWRAIDGFLPPIGREKCVYRGLDGGTRAMYQRNGGFQTLDDTYPQKRQLEELITLFKSGSRDKAFDKVIEENLIGFLKTFSGAASYAAS